MLSDPIVFQAMRRHHLFQRMPEDSMRDICSRAHLRRIDSGHTLFHQGDKAERFYFLADGQVKLHRAFGNGRDKLVEVIKPGNSFAEALLFTGIKEYPVSATALKASVVVSVEGGSYRRLLEEQPQICLDILATLSVRLHQRLNEIDTLTLANASQRVIRFLMLESESSGGIIDFDVPKCLVATRLGIQPETFSRILHRLVDAGLIRIDRRRVHVMDPKALAAVTD
jgi:CRP-like cAMP-binding protein